MDAICDVAYYSKEGTINIYPAISTLYSSKAVYILAINCCCDGCVHGCERLLTAGTAIRESRALRLRPQCPNIRVRLEKQENGKYRAVKKQGEKHFNGLKLRQEHFKAMSNEMSSTAILS